MGHVAYRKIVVNTSVPSGNSGDSVEVLLSGAIGRLER